MLAVDLLHLVGERPAQEPGIGDLEFVDKVGEIQVGRQGDRHEDVIGFTQAFAPHPEWRASAISPNRAKPQCAFAGAHSQVVVKRIDAVVQPGKHDLLRHVTKGIEPIHGSRQSARH